MHDRKFPEIILPIMRKTREMLMPFWGNVEILAQKGTNSTSVVTKLDQEIELYLKECLALEYPDIAYVGEEFGGNRDAESFWLIDPIDGTGHFVHGLPFCTVMLALIEHGEVIFSVIYDFTCDAMYHAEKGKGAYKDWDRPEMTKRLQVSNRAMSDSYTNFETHLDKAENLDTFMRLRKKTVFMNTVNAGKEFIFLAEGKTDARLGFDPHGKDYDFAPGLLLVKEAGGIVTNVGKSTYDYRDVSHIATNPFMYKELTEGEDAIFPIKE